MKSLSSTNQQKTESKGNSATSRGSVETVSKVVTDLEQQPLPDIESYVRVTANPGYESDSSQDTEKSATSLNLVDDKQLLLRRPRKVKFGFGCLLTFAVLCPILLITGGVIVRSACNRLRHSHLNRIPASCALTGVEEIQVNTTCICGKCEGRNSLKWTCFSSYPCYVLNVTYSAEDRDKSTLTGPGVVLGINTSTPCSIDLTVDCYIEPEMNRKLVEEEVVALQEQSPAIGCVHNKEEPTEVRLSKNYKVIGMATLVHCYFWPAMFFFLSLLWLCYVSLNTAGTLYHMRQYAIWRKQQALNYISPTSSEELYYWYLDKEKHLAEMNYFDKITEFFQNQIISREEEEGKKRAECLQDIEQTEVLETDSGNLWIRPQFRPANPMARSSVLIQEILERDAEGSTKKAKLEADRILSLEGQEDSGPVENPNESVSDKKDE